MTKITLYLGNGGDYREFENVCNVVVGDGYVKFRCNSKTYYIRGTYIIEDDGREA